MLVIKNSYLLHQKFKCTNYLFNKMTYQNFPLLVYFKFHSMIDRPLCHKVFSEFLIPKRPSQETQKHHKEKKTSNTRNPKYVIIAKTYVISSKKMEFTENM